MNDLQINQKLQSVSNYLGTFAIDELNQIKVSFSPSFIVINLDERATGGSHWIALAIYPNVVYICDSLGGIKPSTTTSDDILIFLSPLIENRKVFITRQLQPTYASTCGLFCVTFVNEMTKTNSFKDFIALFTSDLTKNNAIIKFLNKKI